MPFSVDNDVMEPDLSAAVRIIMLIISVIFGVFRAKVEDLLKGRPEHMELLQNVYRELSVAALISMFLSLIGTGSTTADISQFLGFPNGDRVNESLHTLHIVFLLGIMLYMGMCTTILAMLRMIVNSLKRWDDQTIQSGIGEMQILLQQVPSNVTFPVIYAIQRSIQQHFAKRKLAWLMYREVFFMQFVCVSEDSPSDFSYVRYLRLAIYEVCLQLTEIRGTAGVVIVIMILIRWIRVRYLDMNLDIGLYVAIVWEILSFAYVQHVNSRIMRLYREYLIDTRKFTKKNLQDFQDRVEKFGLHEAQQTHDTSDSPKIVVERDPGLTANSILEQWMQHKVQREKRREQLVRMAAAKFLKTTASNNKYKTNQVVPEKPDVPGSTGTPDPSDQTSFCTISQRNSNFIEDQRSDVHQLQIHKTNIAGLQNFSAAIGRKISTIKQQADNHLVTDLNAEKTGRDSTEQAKLEVQKHRSSNDHEADLQSHLIQSPRSRRYSSEANAARLLAYSTSSGPERNNSTPDNSLRLSPTQIQGSPSLFSGQSVTSVSIPALNLEIKSPLDLYAQSTLTSPTIKTNPTSSPRPSLSQSSVNPLSPGSNREKASPSRRASQNSDQNEHSISLSGTNLENTPSALRSNLEDAHGSKNESPSRKGRTHQDGHHGFRQSVKKSLKKPADEIAKKYELDKRRSTSLRESIRRDSETNNQLPSVSNKKHLYTFRLIASFGGSKLEQSQGDDLERSLRWWASPGAQGLMTILHSIVLVDTIVFGMTLYLLTIGDNIELLAILLPLVCKLLLAPIMIYNFTIITSSGSMARIELLMLAIHQKMEEDTIAKIGRA